jgi:hypothetical protein
MGERINSLGGGTVCSITGRVGLPRKKEPRGPDAAGAFGKTR